jgi:ABC-type transport system substrate-binding protein
MWEHGHADFRASTDNTNWTIKIKSGYTFTNGEAVNSDSFIRAWNYTAYGPNAQNNAYFMSRIDGIDDMAAGEDPDGDGPQTAPDPKSKELSGLKKVDDLTFTVKLTAAFASFPATIGYSGFFPVAEACLANFDACNEAPIGNGPYKIEGSWQHDDEIVVVRNADFAGDKTLAKADKMTYKIFADVGAGYDASPRATWMSCTRCRRRRSRRPRALLATASTSAPATRSPTSASRCTTTPSRTSGSVRHSRWRSTVRRSSTPSSTAGSRLPLVW